MTFRFRWSSLSEFGEAFPEESRGVTSSEDGLLFEESCRVGDVVKGRLASTRR
jgi:hypothetical protein